MKKINNALKISSMGIFLLPSNNDELKSFINKNRIELSDYIVNSIEDAIKKDIPVIELFTFKNSPFVITISMEKDFKTNLDNIYNYYVSSELYERCSKVVKLQKILNERIHKNEEQKVVGKFGVNKQ
jgi:hypothetical protein